MEHLHAKHFVNRVSNIVICCPDQPFCLGNEVFIASFNGVDCKARASPCYPRAQVTQRQKATLSLCGCWLPPLSWQWQQSEPFLVSACRAVVSSTSMHELLMSCSCACVQCKWWKCKGTAGLVFRAIILHPSYPLGEHNKCVAPLRGECL